MNQITPLLFSSFTRKDEGRHCVWLLMVVVNSERLLVVNNKKACKLDTYRLNVQSVGESNPCYQDENLAS